MLRPIGRLLISLFVVFHFTAVCTWVLDYTSAQNASGTKPHRLLSGLKTSTRDPVHGTERTALRQLVARYIDYTGLYQYWDFFAPAAPVSYPLLRVCDRIRENTHTGWMKCPHPLYKSFDGDLDSVPPSYSITNSREFRLVENLSRLNRPDLYEKFLRYWVNKSLTQGHSNAETVYAVISTYRLHPGKQPTRNDEIVWLLAR